MISPAYCKKKKCVSLVLTPMGYLLCKWDMIPVALNVLRECPKKSLYDCPGS